jgi:hypothetical protein
MGQTFFLQEVDAAHGLLHLQALLHLSGLHIPEADRLVIRTYTASSTLAPSV